MTKQRIPLITPDMYRNLPDQTTEILNRIITEVNNYQNITLELTNEIIALRKQLKEVGPTPTPTGGWQQILAFDINNMGTTHGYCLKNVREGFGIQSGTFTDAKADMDSQISNRTIHYGTPPADIAVPIYYDSWVLVPEGHVAVWDHGRVYSDGVEYPDIESVTRNYIGWGELCDGVRVVAPAS